MPAGDAQTAVFPDGLTPRHAAEANIRPLLARLLPTMFLGAVIGVSFTGVYGGLKNPEIRSEGNGATLTIDAPAVLRNGEFFEMRFRIEADAPIDDATLAIDASYLRDITVNTMLPQAEKEEAKNGTYSFSYGPLAAGEGIDVKIDGQVNPALFAGTKGVVAIRDGETELVRQPVELTVLP